MMIINLVNIKMLSLSKIPLINKPNYFCPPFQHSRNFTTQNKVIFRHTTVQPPSGQKKTFLSKEEITEIWDLKQSQPYRWNASALVDKYQLSPRLTGIYRGKV